MSNGFYVIANTQSGDLITTSPPIRVEEMPVGATAYPISRVMYVGLKDGTFTWDPITRSVIASQALNEQGNKASLTAKLWDDYLANTTYIDTPNPNLTQNDINRQVKELSRQVNRLIRLVTSRLESDE